MSVYTSYEFETDNTFSETAGEVVASLREMFEEIDKRAAEIRLNQENGVSAVLQAVKTQPLMVRAVLESVRDEDVPVAESGDVSQLETLRPKKLRSLLRSAKATLLNERSTRLSGEIRCALEEMNYRVEAPRRSDSQQVQLRGKHEDGTAITVALKPSKDTAEIDMSGFEPGVCLDARRRLVEQLKKRGIRLKIRHSERHDNKCGGGLAQATPSLTASEDTQVVADRKRRVMSRQVT